MDNRIRGKVHEHLLDLLSEVDETCRKNNLRYFLIGGTLLGAVRHGGFIPWDDDIDIAMPRDDFKKFISITQSNQRSIYYLDYKTNNRKYWLPFAKIRMKNTAYLESSIKRNLEKDGFWVDIFPLDYTKNSKKSYLFLKKKIIKFLSSILFNKNSKTIKDTYGFKRILFVIIKMVPNSLIFNIRDKIMQSENSDICSYYINYGSQYSVDKQTHDINQIFPTKKISFEGRWFQAPKNSDYILTNIYGKNYMKLPPREKRITHNPRYIRFKDGEEVFFNE